jgi:hypothetical protein
MPQAHRIRPPRATAPQPPATRGPRHQHVQVIIQSHAHGAIQSIQQQPATIGDGPEPRRTLGEESRQSPDRPLRLKGQPLAPRRLVPPRHRGKTHPIVVGHSGQTEQPTHLPRKDPRTRKNDPDAPAFPRAEPGRHPPDNRQRLRRGIFANLEVWHPPGRTPAAQIPRFQPLGQGRERARARIGLQFLCPKAQMLFPGTHPQLVHALGLPPGARDGHQHLIRATRARQQQRPQRPTRAAKAVDQQRADRPRPLPLRTLRQLPITPLRRP